MSQAGRHLEEKDEIQTPDTSHLAEQMFESVYEPAEDSFLLLDSLEQQLPDLRQLGPLIGVEVGCGSGIISTALSLKLRSTLFLATDVNPVACAATRFTAARNGAQIQVVQTDVLSGLDTRLHGQVDLLVCNPPYVATHSEEVGGRGISAAWAGGADGMVVTDRVLGGLKSLLSPQGVAYLVLEQCNDPPAVIRRLDRPPFSCKAVLSRRAGREHLYVVRIARCETSAQ